MTRTAGELAEYLGTTLHGNSSLHLGGVASPERARPEDLIYVSDARSLERAQASAAACAIVAPQLDLPGKTTIVASDAKFAFAKAATWLMPRPPLRPEIHPTAIVAATAQLAPNIRVGPYVVIEDDVEIKRGSNIEAFCFLGRASYVGEDCWLHPRVTLYAGARLNNRVELHTGVVIGADGFGYVFGESKHNKFPQIGTVEIGDDVEIGCNSAVDRGSLDSTLIERGVKIDNLVQVAHNVTIGEHSVVAAQTGISGSSKLGKGVIVGGQVGIADHCTLEDGSIAGAQAGIPTGKTIRSGQTVWGTPARPIERFKELYALYSRLPDFFVRLRKLEESEMK
ncbi:MAG: UDP-3-O-(3-hydroxymyristoyl)glucosamine N-acyltransferase [Candidatus Acidiferrales bacterium]